MSSAHFASLIWTHNPTARNSGVESSDLPEIQVFAFGTPPHHNIIHKWVESTPARKQNIVDAAVAWNGR